MPRGAPYTHPCVAPGCSAWGAYGLNAPGTKREDERWYCGAHVPAGALPWLEARRAPREGDVF